MIGLAYCIYIIRSDRIVLIDDAFIAIFTNLSPNIQIFVGYMYGKHVTIQAHMETHAQTLHP